MSFNDLFQQFLTFHFDEIFEQQFEYFSTQRRRKTTKKFVKMLWFFFSLILIIKIGLKKWAILEQQDDVKIAI